MTSHTKTYDVHIANYGKRMLIIQNNNTELIFIKHLLFIHFTFTFYFYIGYYLVAVLNTEFNHRISQICWQMVKNPVWLCVH